MKDYEKILRKLAKTDHWQSLYTYSKEFNFNLFKNKRASSFSEIQLIFLRYLSFYNTIYVDICMGDVKECVMEKHLYEDAYMVYKRHKKDAIKPNTENELKQQKNFINKKRVTGKTIFTKARKK